MVDWTVDQKIRFATLFVTIIIMITGISVCFTKIIEVKKGLTIGDIERELKKANEEKNELLMRPKVYRHHFAKVYAQSGCLKKDAIIFGSFWRLHNLL